MSADFLTRQIRVNQIINSGSTSASPLLIYGLGSATDASGGFTSSHFTTGSDTWLFISGSSGSKNSTSRGVVTFKGDVVISGSIYNSAGTAYVAGGGGGGSNNWNELSPSPRLNTTASVAIAGGLGNSFAAQDAGSDVFFYVSGSSASVSLFGGPIVSSGSITVKDAGVTLGTISGTGAISGSALQTVGNLNVQGTSGLIGDVTVTGDVAINGGDLTSTAPAFNLLAGVSIVNLGSSVGKVVIPGDLFVSGTTTYMDVENMLVQDPIVGFGFTTGSSPDPLPAAGDRGFVGGIAGSGNNVAFVWSNLNSTFVATKTTSGPNDATVALTTLQPVRASSFQVNGISAAIKEDTGSVIVSGSSVYLDSGNSRVQFMQAGFNQALYIDSSNLQNPLIVGNAGPGVANQTLTVSGTSVVIDSIGGTTTITKGGSLFLTVVTGAYTTPVGSTGNAAIISAAAGTAAVFGGTVVSVLSGSAINLNAGSAGVRIQRDGTTFATFTSGSGATASLSTITDKNFTVGSAGTGALTISGSGGVVLNSVAATGVSFQGDGTSLLKIASPASNQVSIETMGSTSTLTIGGADSTISTLNLGTGAESIFIGETASTTTFNGSVVPVSDATYNLGSPSNRWANIYTGDLHLRNERGDYTLIEESDFLSIRFNKNGKRYKFLLERVPELDE